MIFGDLIVLTNSLRGSVPNLRPVVRKTLGHDWHQFIAELKKSWTVFFILKYVFTTYKDSANNEVANFSDEPVNVVNSLEDTRQNSINIKLL